MKSANPLRISQKLLQTAHMNAKQLLKRYKIKIL